MTGGMAVAPPFLAVETAFLPTRSGGFQVTAFQEAAGPCHLALHRGHLKAATPLLRVQNIHLRHLHPAGARGLLRRLHPQRHRAAAR